MSLRKEIAFEDGICQHLAAHAWHDETGAADRYDRPRALFIEDLLAWVQESQKQAWEDLEAANGVTTANVLV